MTEEESKDEIILWAIEISGNSSAIRSFLRVTGIPYKEVNAWGKTRTEEYISKFPTNLAPAIEHGSICLSENAAMMRYLCRAFPQKAGIYYPSDKWNEIDMLLDYMGSGILDLLPKAVYPTLGFPAYPGDVAAMESTKSFTEEAAKAAGAAMLKQLEDKYAGIFLAKTKFLLSNTPTIADFRFAPMINFFKVGSKVPPRIQTYYDEMEKLPGFTEACRPVVAFTSKHWK